MNKTSLALALIVAATPALAAPRNDKIYAAAEANKDGALALLRQIVNIDSGTGDIAGGDKVEAILAPQLKALGAQVRTEKSEKPGFADNLVAVFHGQGKGRILIIGHIDTVFAPGTAAKRPFTIIDGRAHGPGVVDCKGGVANAVTALKILHDQSFRDYASITLILDGSEERGSPGSTALIKKLAAGSDVALSVEGGFPPDGLIIWRKGGADIHIAVKGRSAHAGVAPQDGRNAASELVHQLTAIDSAFAHIGTGTTVNLTLLEGGERSNIIPDSADATLDVRFRKPGDFDQVLAKVRELSKHSAIPDTAITISTDPAFPPLAQSPAGDALVARAGAIYGELGKTLRNVGSGGASESALAASVGAPAMDGLGFVGADWHTDRESMDTTSVAPRLYLLTRLLMDLGAAPPAKPG